MTVAHDLPPSNKQDAKIPTQTSPEINNYLMLRSFLTDKLDPELLISKKINMDLVRHRLKVEQGVYPSSISLLREVYTQRCISYPCDAAIADESLDPFTQRAVLTRKVYEDQLLDLEDPSGKNRENYGEVLDLVEQFDETALMSAMNEVIKNNWVKDNPYTIKEIATESYAIACLITLDANYVTPDFMLVDENPTV